MKQAGLLIEDLAARVGQYVWWERRLCTVLADWACDEVDHRARLHFHTLGRGVEAHAFIWEVLLPDSPALNASERVAPPPAWKDDPDVQVTGLSPPTFGRLVVLNEALLPELAASLNDFTDRLSPVSEGPELRHADLIARDLRRFAAQGEELLAELLAENGSPNLSSEVASAVGRLRQTAGASGRSDEICVEGE